MAMSNESKWKRLKNNIVMRISILKSVNAVEHQHKSMKGKLIIGIIVHIFNCDYTSFLKNINQRI
jgi:hypothetical protein